MGQQRLLVQSEVATAFLGPRDLGIGLPERRRCGPATSRLDVDEAVDVRVSKIAARSWSASMRLTRVSSN